MVFEVIGILSAVIFISCDIPYLVDAIKAKIQPHRVSWGISFLINAIGFANQSASGASNSLWLFGASTLMTGSIFLVSLKNGVGGHSKLDLFSLIFSLFGVALWQVSNSPAFSVYANVLVGIVCLLPTFAKTRKKPESENGIAWLGGSIAAALAAVSVGAWNLQLLIIPITASILQGYMVYLIYLRKNIPKK